METIQENPIVEEQSPTEQTQVIQNGVVEQTFREVILEHVAKAPGIADVLRDPWKTYLEWLSGLKRLLD